MRGSGFEVERRALVKTAFASPQWGFPTLTSSFLESVWPQHAYECQVPDSVELCCEAHCLFWLFLGAFHIMFFFAPSTSVLEFQSMNI